MEKETKNKKKPASKKATTKKKAPAKKVETAKKTTPKKVDKKIPVPPKVEAKKEEPKVTVSKKINEKLNCLKKFFKDEKQAVIFGGLLVAVAILFYSVGFAVATKPIPQLSDGTEILAQIDEKTFTADELYQSIKGRFGFGVLLEKIDDYIVNEKIETNEDVIAYADSQMEQLKSQLEQQGEELENLLRAWGFENEEGIYQYFINERKRTMLVNDYIRENITDREIEEYYKNDITGEMTVKHILISPDYDGAETNEDFDAADEKALEKAKKLIERLNDGEDFATLAEEYSDDEGTKEFGGLFGGFTKNQVVPEFWDGSVALEDGEYTKEPVRTMYGYHIILRESMGEKPAMEDIIDEIKDELLEEKRQSVENLEEKIMIEIRATFNITINDRDILREYEEFKKRINE